MDWRKNIIDRIRSFLDASGMSARRFGVEAVGDSKFVSRLERGSGVTLTTIERAEAFMRSRQSASRKEVA